MAPDHLLTANYTHILAVLEYLRDFVKQHLCSLSYRKILEGLVAPRDYMMVPELMGEPGGVELLIDELEGILHMTGGEICSTFRFFFGDSDEISSINNRIWIKAGRTTFNLITKHMPDVLIDIPQLREFKKREMEAEARLRLMEAEWADKRAEFGAFLHVLVGKVVQKPQKVPPLSLDRSLGGEDSMWKAGLRNSVFWKRTPTAFLAIRFLEQGRVCMATYPPLRWGQAPVDFIRGQRGKMEKGEEHCRYGKLIHRDFKPNPFSEVFSVPRDGARGEIMYHLAACKHGIAVDMYDAGSPMISRMFYEIERM